MPKFKSSNKFTKNFKKRSPFREATATSGMDLSTARMDQNLVEHSNKEVESRKAADVQKGLADSDKTYLFGLQAGLHGVSQGIGSFNEAVGDDYYTDDAKAKRKSNKGYKKYVKSLGEGKDVLSFKEWHERGGEDF